MTFTKMTLLDVQWDRGDCGDNGSEECACDLPSELSIIINRPMDDEDIDELIEASTDTYLHCIKSVGGTKTEEITGDMYVIRSGFESGDCPLYWNNAYGWIGKDGASIYQDNERNEVKHIPLNSKWEKLE